MQYDESKLIFFTGAPGSKWSATAHILTHNQKMLINTSDYDRETRYYQHPNPPVAHQGAYWGPGFPWGENFHKINEMSKEDILKEIDAPYTDKSWDKYRLIKCHQFALNLDWIKETFPLAKIMIVLRPNYQCIEGWLTAGGFDGITYPDYNPYYVNAETFRDKAYLELEEAREFIDKNDLDIQVIREKYWKERWGIEKNTSELDLYMTSIERRTNGGRNYDTMIAEYNF